MFCKNCASAINPGAAICVNCGVEVGKGNAYCPNCAEPTAPEAVVCMKCGYSLAPSATTGAKSKMVAGLLGIFLGWLGIHNFYLGYKKKAIIQLCLGAGGMILSIIIIGIFAVMAASIWGIVDGIMILTGKIDTDADGNKLAD